MWCSYNSSTVGFSGALFDFRCASGFHAAHRFFRPAAFSSSPLELSSCLFECSGCALEFSGYPSSVQQFVLVSRWSFECPGGLQVF